MLGRCPSIEQLEALADRDDRKIIKHAEKCESCQGVLALVAERTTGVETEVCAEIELLKSSGAEENERVRSHISMCESCRQLWVDDSVP